MKLDIFDDGKYSVPHLQEERIKKLPLEITKFLASQVPMERSECVLANRKLSGKGLAIMLSKIFMLEDT